MLFINFSNHPSYRWDKSQFDEASKYGEVVDIPFPNVPSGANEEEISNLAVASVNKICSTASKTDLVMAQGEYTLTYKVIGLLKDRGIKVVSACTDRDVVERIDEAGNLIKEARFKFVRFREY